MIILTFGGIRICFDKTIRRNLCIYGIIIVRTTYIEKWIRHQHSSVDCIICTSILVSNYYESILFIYHTVAGIGHALHGIQTLRKPECVCVLNTHLLTTSRILITFGGTLSNSKLPNKQTKEKKLSQKMLSVRDSKKKHFSQSNVVVQLN